MSHQIAPESTAPSDPELIAAVRAGDGHAYGLLFERHRGAALNLARQIAGPSDADDLVSDAFMKVHRVLANGGGPDVAFRAYLLTAVRRLHVDRIRAASKVTPSDDLEQFDPGVPFTDTAVDKFENAAAAKAFASLPERWQLVLWHLEVEGQKPAEVAPLLGMTANGVSALAYRAREGLRQAYLQMHMADTAAEECRWVTERLGAHVRKGLSKRDAAKVDQHLDECTKCAAVYLELTEVNSNLSGILAPALLGTAAAGYLGAAGSGMSMGSVASLLFKARHLAKAHAAATASGAAASVVVVGVTAAAVVNHLNHDPGRSQSDPPLNEGPVATSPTDPGDTGTGTDPGKPGHKPGHKPDKPRHHKPDHNKPNKNNQPPVAVPPPVVPPPTTPPTTTPTPTPQPPPIHADEHPNPQDDDPPANPDDTGLPPIKPPPPEPVDVDVALALTVSPAAPGRYLAVIDTTTADPATSLTLSIDVSEFVSLGFSGWACDAPAPGVTHYTCTIDSADPADLQLSVVFPRDTVPTISATVTAADNTDPDTANNSGSWTGPPIP